MSAIRCNGLREGSFQSTRLKCDFAGSSGDPVLSGARRLDHDSALGRKAIWQGHFIKQRVVPRFYGPAARDIVAASVPLNA